MPECPCCGKQGHEKPDSIITVRLHSTLHAHLKILAHSQQKSMNQLCVDVLREKVDAEIFKQKDRANDQENELGVVDSVTDWDAVYGRRGADCNG